MKDNLEKLRDRIGQDLSGELARLEEQIAEMEEEPSRSEGSGLSRTSSSEAKLPADDATIRGMFFTLRA